MSYLYIYVLCIMYYVCNVFMYTILCILKNFYSSIHFIYLFISEIKMQKIFHNNRIIINILFIYFNKNYIIIFIKKSF